MSLQSRLNSLITQIGVDMKNRAPASVVTVLPGSGLVDGLIVDFLVDDLNGIVWRFKWRAAGGVHKWEFIGGPPVFASVDTQETRAGAASFAALTTPGPSVTVPLPGYYRVQCGSMQTVINPSSAYTLHSYDVVGSSTVAASGNDAARTVLRPPSGSTDSVTVDSPMRTKQALIGGTQFVSKYMSTPGAGDFSLRWIMALPVKCGAA